MGVAATPLALTRGAADAGERSSSAHDFFTGALAGAAAGTGVVLVEASGVADAADLGVDGMAASSEVVAAVVVGEEGGRIGDEADEVTVLVVESAARSLS